MISLLLLCLLASPRPSLAMEPHEVAAALEEALDSVHAKIDTTKAHMQSQLEGYKSVISDLARQTMLMQFNMEERARSDGDSGVKVLRGLNKGPENYYENGFIANAFNQIHDHSNYDTTVGMGEVIAVLNGVQFQTRHNDYKLNRPSTSSQDYHATEKIKLPDVPPEVLALESVDDQILEMREWFKAFKTQNSTHRDYTKYFKPIMCYLEGAWVIDTGKDSAIDEPFDSERHQIDASSWFDLQEKVRFASYTGSKSRLENFAYLPTTIMEVNETSGLPSYAQWNYRILCSDLKEDIPTKELRMMDDLSFRVPRKNSKADMKYRRGARFRLYEQEKDGFTKYSKLDRLFYTIPGKDNLPAQNMTQAAFDGDKMLDMAHEDEDVLLNTGYYHRFYKYDTEGAMGIKSVARGFNDASLFVAQTTQERVAPAGIEVCKYVEFLNSAGKTKKRQECEMVYNRFSYAIPLEIIYLTPLQTWNPYNIETGKDKSVATDNNKRNGGMSATKAFNGTDPSRFYITPTEFFKGRVDSSDPADTVRKSVGVLDKVGNLRKTTASGVMIVLQEIEGVGKVRLRYPIAPVHGEGAPVWKELNALKKMVNDQSGPSTGQPKTVSFTMSTAQKDPPGPHEHDFEVTWEEFKVMINDNAEISVKTDPAFDHQHDLVVKYESGKNRFVYVQCDDKGRNKQCWDKHPRTCTVATENEEVEVALKEKMVV